MDIARSPIAAPPELWPVAHLARHFLADLSVKSLPKVHRTSALDFRQRSGRRESNPHSQLGRLELYH